MADVKKKINLEVTTNANKETTKVKQLNTELGKTDKLVKSIANNSKKIFGNDIKNMADSMKTLTKSIDSVKNVLDSLSKVSGSVTSSIKTLQQAASASKNISIADKVDENAKQKERRRERYKKKKEYLEVTVPEIEERIEAKKLELESKRKLELMESGIKRSQATMGQMSRAFESGSLLNIGSTMLTQGSGNLFGAIQSKLSNSFLKTQQDFAEKIAAEDKIILNPSSTKAAKDAARQRKKSLNAELNKEETTLKMKNARLTAASAAISAAINTAAKALNYFGNVVKQTTGITVGLKENFNNLLTSIGGILSLEGGAATYSSGSTLYTNARARAQQMKYGLSSGANFALSRTMSLMGMQGDEDLMYMNRPQQKLFSAMMQKYTAWYDKLESSGVLARVQEAQMDLQILKEEIVMDFMQWFSENKEDILNGITAIAKLSMIIAQGVLKVTGFLGKAFGWMGSGGFSSEGMIASAAYSDNIINRGSRTTNININMNNTATGVLSSQEGMEKFFSEQIDKVSKEVALLENLE